jgi:hypothetical protein
MPTSIPMIPRSHGGREVPTLLSRVSLVIALGFSFYSVTLWAVIHLAFICYRERKVEEGDLPHLAI